MDDKERPLCEQDLQKTWTDDNGRALGEIISVGMGSKCCKWNVDPSYINCPLVADMSSFCHGWIPAWSLRVCVCVRKYGSMVATKGSRILVNKMKAALFPLPHKNTRHACFCPVFSGGCSDRDQHHRPLLSALLCFMCVSMSWCPDHACVCVA